MASCLNPINGAKMRFVIDGIFCDAIDSHLAFLVLEVLGEVGVIFIAWHLGHSEVKSREMQGEDFLGQSL